MRSVNQYTKGKVITTHNFEGEKRVCVHHWKEFFSWDRKLYTSQHVAVEIENNDQRRKVTHITFTCLLVTANHTFIPQTSKFKYLLDRRIRDGNPLDLKFKVLYWITGSNHPLPSKIKYFFTKVSSFLTGPKFATLVALATLEHTSQKALRLLSEVPWYINNN